MKLIAIDFLFRVFVIIFTLNHLWAFWDRMGLFISTYRQERRIRKYERQVTKQPWRGYSYYARD